MKYIFMAIFSLPLLLGGSCIFNSSNPTVSIDTLYIHDTISLTVMTTIHDTINHTYPPAPVPGTPNITSITSYNYGSTNSMSGSVSIFFCGVPNASGYKIYYSTDPYTGYLVLSGSYSKMIDSTICAGKPRYENFSPSPPFEHKKMYYIKASALNALGIEGPLSTFLSIYYQ
jgi:hypothetical protein